MNKKKNECDLSKKLIRAAKYGKDGVRKVLFELDIKGIDTLERKVLKQFEGLTDVSEKSIYADNIVNSNILPVCVEINRIVNNCYTLEQYLKNRYNLTKERAEYYYSVYEELKRTSKVLRLRIANISQKREKNRQIKYAKVYRKQKLRVR